jgi:regulator of sigma D
VFVGECEEVCNVTRGEEAALTGVLQNLVGQVALVDLYKHNNQHPVVQYMQVVSLKTLPTAVLL